MTERLAIRSLCSSLRQASFNRGIQRTLPGLLPDGMTIEALAGIGNLPL